MSRALIIGCGYLGTRVARHLLRNGFQVTATTRGKPPETRGKPPETRGVDHRAVSFAQPDLQTLDSTFSHVLYTVPPLAGVDPERPVSWIRQHLEDSNSWIGYVSTTAVYGDTGGEWIHEESPVRGSSEAAKSRAAYEAAFREEFVTLDVIRAAAIYGPGRSAPDRVIEGRAQRIDKPGHVFSRIHVDDLSLIVCKALMSPCGQRVFNGSDDEPSSQQEVVAYAAELLGIEAPPLIPFHQAALTPGALRFWNETRRVSNVLTKRVLDMDLTYPTYREGVAAIARDRVQDPDREI